MKKITVNVNERHLEDLKWLVKNKVYKNREEAIDQAFGKLIHMFKQWYSVWELQKEKEQTFEEFCREKNLI
ncbi:MAG: hypothetical protein JXA43_01930 [Candidatus Diapherotrites archaeon]|nr:hypothetical protein [Candidatus Diapherotrites archaeon]